MMNADLKYITNHFIDAEELCRISDISVDTLDDLIEKELIPNYSYKIERKTTITSPLGDRSEEQTFTRYFSKNIVDLVRENLKAENANMFKQKLKEEFVLTFIAQEDKSFAYGNILNQNGEVDEKKLDEAFETEWEYYLKGIYGICTLNANGMEIAKKEIAVKKLMSFIESNTGTQLTESKKQELLNLNEQFNEVSNLFAPYQRKNSSRGKYLDETLNKYSLDGLIKDY